MRQAPANGVVFVPVKVLAQMADHSRLARIGRTGQDAAEAAADTNKGPLRLVIDEQGRVALKDGHHRIVQASKDGVTHLAVSTDVRRSSRIKSHGIPMADVFGDLLGGIVAGQAPPTPRPLTPAALWRAMNSRSWSWAVVTVLGAAFAVVVGAVIW